MIKIPNWLPPKKYLKDTIRPQIPGEPKIEKPKKIKKPKTKNNE